MGFFSWKSAISKKSIPAYPHAGKPIKMSEVVMILPDNSTVMGTYDGYGRIDGVDIFVELAPYYFGEKVERDYVFNNRKYVESSDGVIKEVNKFRWDEPIPFFGGKNLNTLRYLGYKIYSDYDKIMEMVKIILQTEYTGQDYDELPTSERCPDQGFFY